jgi:hypothetical protein
MGQAAPPDLAPLRALQRWLQALGPAEVVIPYAGLLAQQYDASSVRARRDFGQLLTLISAHALLHRATRQVDSQGRIVATLDDYRAIREIAADIFAACQRDGLTDAQRQAVEAVRKIYEHTKSSCRYEDVAKRLGIDQSAAMRRLRNPLRLGYVQNLQDRPRQPAMLLPGRPLPDLSTGLPGPEELQTADARANAAALAADGREAAVCTSDPSAVGMNVVNCRLPQHQREVVNMSART